MASCPPHYNIDGTSKIVEESAAAAFMGMEERKRQPLHIKIENALPLVMKNASKRNFIEKQFKLPIKDPDVGLYLLPSGKYF